MTNSNGQVIGYVSVGEMLTLGESSNGKTFVTVQETGIQGYLANSNIKDITSGINQSLVKMNRKGYIINVSTDVHVRANATMDSQVLADLSNNTNLTITGKQGNWIRVNVNGIKGYVFGEYVEEGASINGGTIIVPNNNNVKTTSTSKNNKIVVNPNVINNSNNIPAINHNENNIPAPAINHNDNKTTPVVNHNENNTPAPAINHNDNKTAPVVNHSENNTPAPAVNHNDNKTTPVVNHSESNTPAPAVNHNDNKTGIKVGSSEFNRLLDNDLFNKINNFREQNGGQALQQNSVLQAMANWKANNCVEYNYCQHLDPQGQYTYQVKQFENINFNTYEENLAETNISDFSNSGYVTSSQIESIATQLVNCLINSPAHRYNILNNQVNETAIQVGVMSNGNIVMVQEFGSGVSW